jgi:regulator of nucleoside diphosphate kinase
MTRTILRASDTRRPDILVTKWDLGNLETLLSAHAERWNWRSVEYLVRELMRATIVEEGAIPDNVVTMGSRVEYRERGRGASAAVTLSYPGEREFFDDAISVLTPIGAALLGMSEGQSICYAGPDGCPVTIEVIKVMHQPESSHQKRTKPASRSRADRPRASLQDR